MAVSTSLPSCLSFSCLGHTHTLLRKRSCPPFFFPCNTHPLLVEQSSDLMVILFICMNWKKKKTTEWVEWGLVGSTLTIALICDKHCFAPPHLITQSQKRWSLTSVQRVPQEVYFAFFQVGEKFRLFWIGWEPIPLPTHAPCFRCILWFRALTNKLCLETVQCAR